MIVKFLTPLQVEKLAGDYWRVIREFVARCGDQLVVVPAEYVTDFASVPRLPVVYLTTGGIGQKAAALHDWLYSQASAPRTWCDEVLRDALAAEGVSWWRRALMYRAVRLAGARHYGAGA